MTYDEACLELTAEIERLKRSLARYQRKRKQTVTLKDKLEADRKIQVMESEIRASRLSYYEDADNMAGV